MPGGPLVRTLARRIALAAVVAFAVLAALVALTFLSPRSEPPTPVHAPLEEAEEKSLSAAPERASYEILVDGQRTCSAVFSPDGRHVLAGSYEGTAALLESATGSVIRVLKGPSSRLAFLPDGRHLMTMGRGEDNLLTLVRWDAKTGERVKTLTWPQAYIGVTVRAYGLSPGGRHALVLSGGRLGLYDAETRVRLKSFDWHSFLGPHAAFSPDGRYMLTESGRDDTAVLWDLEKDKMARAFKGHEAEVACCAFSWDGRFALTGSRDKTAIMWNVSTGEPIERFEGHEGEVSAAAFSPDGKLVLTGEEEHPASYQLSLDEMEREDVVVSLWNAQTAERLRTFEGHKGIITHVSFSPDGKRILSDSSGGTARVCLLPREHWPDAGVEALGLLADRTGAEAACEGADRILRLLKQLPASSQSRDAESKSALAAYENAKRTFEEGRFAEAAKLFAGAESRLRELLSRDAIEGAVLTLPAEEREELLKALPEEAVPEGLCVEYHLLKHGWYEFKNLGAALAHGIDTVAFSPDGRFVLAGSRDNVASLWDATTGRRVRRFRGRGGFAVTSAAFLPDGKSALLSDADGAVLWDVSTGQRLMDLKREEQARYFSAAGVLPDGKLLATVESWKAGEKRQSRARLWDSGTGKLVRTCGEFSGAATSIAFSSDGKLLAAASSDGIAVLWDTATGVRLAMLQAHADEVLSVAFSPDGKLVLTGSKDKTAILWETATGKPVRTFKSPSWDVLSVVFSPDGRFILGGCSGNMAVLWDAGTGELLTTFKGHTWSVNSVAFSPDGRHILTGSGDDTARIWRLPREYWSETGAGDLPQKGREDVAKRSGDEIEILLEALGGKRLPLPVNQDDYAFGLAAFEKAKDAMRQGRFDEALKLHAETKTRLVGRLSAHAARAVLEDLVGARRDRALKALPETVVPIELRVERRILQVGFCELKGHGDGVRSVAFSPDGGRILTGSGDSLAVLWDARTGEQVGTLRGHAEAINAVAFSPDGRRALTGGNDKTAVLWNVETGKKVRSFEEHKGEVYYAAFSPDGSRVLTAERWTVEHRAKGDAVLWNAATGERVRTFKGGGERVLAATLSPDGKVILTADREGTAFLWNSSTGEQTNTLELAFPPFAFSPDGITMATGTFGPCALVWNVGSGKVFSALKGRGQLDAVTFSPDGRLLLSAGPEKQAILWDAYTGDRLTTFEGHERWVTSVAFSPDGKRVVSGSQDCTARIWRVPREHLPDP